MSHPSDPDKTLDHAARWDSAVDSPGPRDDGVPAADRLELREEIARGGMGAVLKARDADIGRDVAVKVLLADARGQPLLARRFLEEARITGRLQHPGVVPVYALGRLPDGRPYFAMKLVKGRTLADLLAERADPAADRPRLLHVFEQVCQTLAYTHAHGVIHRDLKPANVMVGAYGEVQVMDWGLAKVLSGDRAAADEAEKKATEVASMIRTPRDEDSEAGEDGSETRAGTAMGTPAYMAPEQARGEIEDVDRRSDVFGLGAVLCEVLTGKPPYVGPGEAALKRARRADLADAFARLDACGADAELIALAKRCLSAEPAHRPGDAAEVSAAATAYRESVAERLRRAELAQAAEAARTEEARATAAQERRARRLTLLAFAASVMVLALVGLAVGLWLQNRWAEQARTARVRQSVEAALDKAHELEKQDRWPESRAVLEPMRAQVEGAGLEDLRRRVEQAVADAALVDRLEAIRLKRSIIVEGDYDFRGTDEAYATAFRDAGLARERDDAETVAARIRASAVREPLTAALDDWVMAANDVQRIAWLREAARRADPDPWRDRFRDPAVWGDRNRLEALAKELLADDKQLARQTPQLLVALGRGLLGVNVDPAPLLAAAQARHPDDFWLNLDLGGALYDARNWDGAVSFYRAAIAVRPSAAAVHYNLGLTLDDKGEQDEAIREYRRAIEIDPSLAQPHNNLGNALNAKGERDEAIREYRRAIELDPKYVKAHYNFGNALNAKGERDEAIREYRRAIELDPKYAEAHCNLGYALRATGQFAESLAAFRAGHQLGSAKPGWPYPSADWVREAEQLAALDQKLAAVLDGKDKPADDAERLALARLCQMPYQKRYAASARFFADAFTHDAKLSEDTQTRDRYNAACAAALAGRGQGMDADELVEAERARLRKQAVAWLRADLAFWTQQAESDKPADREKVQQDLKHWQEDADLSGLRDAAELTKLPADEQDACKKLWADVQALLDKAAPKK